MTRWCIRPGGGGSPKFLELLTSAALGLPIKRKRSWQRHAMMTMVLLLMMMWWWLTGRPCTCLLLPLLVNIAIIFIASSPSTALAHPAPQTITRRWFNPCHGDSPIPLATTPAATTTTTSGSSITSGFLSPTSGSSMTPSDADLADSFRAISTKATRLKRHVRELKDLYVRMLIHLHNLC